MARPEAPTDDQIRRALGRFPSVRPAGFDILPGGLINHSYRVHAEHGDFVLQRLHPVFAAEINDNVHAVTRHLRARGINTPTVVLADDGRPWAELDGEQIWRVTTWVEGVTFAAVSEPAQAHAAGQLLAEFHSALADLEHVFVALRVGAHDTPVHLQRLRDALAAHTTHRLRGRVEPIADELFRSAEQLPALVDVPLRTVHGDPKLSNVVFAGRAEPDRCHAVCMVDLDTVGPMELHLELGDAWRSWCNRGGEDVGDGAFDMDVFGASVAGYSAGLELELEPREREALVHGVEWITLELATRFAADALGESYFGWDPQRFPAAGEHNLVRARGQLSLHRSAVQTRAWRERILREELASGAASR